MSVQDRLERHAPVESGKHAKRCRRQVFSVASRTASSSQGVHRAPLLFGLPQRPRPHGAASSIRACIDITSQPASYSPRLVSKASPKPGRPSIGRTGPQTRTQRNELPVDPGRAGGAINGCQHLRSCGSRRYDNDAELDHRTGTRVGLIIAKGARPLKRSLAATHRETRTTGVGETSYAGISGCAPDREVRAGHRAPVPGRASAKPSADRRPRVARGRRRSGE